MIRKFLLRELTRFETRALKTITISDFNDVFDDFRKFRKRWLPSQSYEQRWDVLYLREQTPFEKLEGFLQEKRRLPSEIHECKHHLLNKGFFFELKYIFANKISKFLSNKNFTKILIFVLVELFLLLFGYYISIRWIRISCIVLFFFLSSLLLVQSFTHIDK